MALEQFTTLSDHLRMIPDPRGEQGRQFVWWQLLLITCWGLLCGQKVVRGIFEWAQAHAALLLEALSGELPRIPSESTLRRALRYVDITQLEAQIAAFGEEKAATIAGDTTTCWEGQAVDGKDLRGANQHGAEVHLVSLVQHHSGIVLAQHPAPAKSNEIKAVPALLAGRDLQGVVITSDALLTQRSLAQQIRDQGGHYLMVVKRNQPDLHDDLQALFAAPRQGPGDDRLSFTSRGKEHGRWETRTLTSSEQLRDYLDWPGAQQVAQRVCQRQRYPWTPATTETTYAVTSLSRAQASPEQLESLWRGHWSIENRNHYVRDETLGEDRCQVFAGHAAPALAALRSGILSLIRTQTWRCVPQALRYYAAHPDHAFSALGLPFS